MTKLLIDHLIDLKQDDSILNSCGHDKQLADKIIMYTNIDFDSRQLLIKRLHENLIGPMIEKYITEHPNRKPQRIRKFISDKVEYFAYKKFRHTTTLGELIFGVALANHGNSITTQAILSDVYFNCFTSLWYNVQYENAVAL